LEEIILQRSKKEEQVHLTQAPFVPDSLSQSHFTTVHVGLEAIVVEHKIVHISLRDYPVGMPFANAMYGLVLVEPKEVLPSLDGEYYEMQGEFYTMGPTGQPGYQPFSMTEAFQDQVGGSDIKGAWVQQSILFRVQPKPFQEGLFSVF